MMAEARSSDDRLPWLEAPRTASRASPAERRVRIALLAVLALFVASTIAVMAYLVGRTTAPMPQRAARPPISALAPPLVEAPAPPPLAPAEIAAEPAAPPPVARMAATPPRAEAPPVRREVAERPAARQATASVRRTPPPRAEPRRYQWPAPSLAGPSGRVVQLGAYPNRQQTNAAWRRLVRAFPHLAIYPRRVTRGAPSADGTRYYRLRIGTKSPTDARALCNRLHSIGRGCIVV